MKLTIAISIAAVLQHVHGDRAAQSVERKPSLCKFACKELHILLRNRVSLPDSPTYDDEQFHYWSEQQAHQRPSCRVTPTSSHDVSLALQVLRANNCPFAVKSGGHASFAGASNIGNGVTFDLRSLNQLKVSSDRKQTMVGAGRLWSSVYMDLDQRNLSVVGGRSGDIGVGGLTLGGGISFFSGRYGWACDNVNNYEVVLADGSIQEVNHRSYPDLFWALRGGGNNFGIVTRFDLNTFEQGKMWGGQTSFADEQVPALNKALYNFNINHEQDPDAAVILAYVYVPSYKAFVASVDLEYSKPVADAPILSNFTSIPSLSSSQRFTNLTDLTLELNATQPAGRRETFWTYTVLNDMQIIEDVQSLYRDKVMSIIHINSVLPALVFQPISTAIIPHFQSNGGNALGIDLSKGPLILINISVAWDNIEDDDAILKFCDEFIAAGAALARERGAHHPYIYQNYASKDQAVFDGYGAANHAKLRAIQKRYDPAGVFSRLQPGYFKV